MVGFFPGVSVVRFRIHCFCQAIQQSGQYTHDYSHSCFRYEYINFIANRLTDQYNPTCADIDAVRIGDRYRHIISLSLGNRLFVHFMGRAPDANRHGFRHSDAAKKHFYRRIIFHTDHHSNPRPHTDAHPQQHTAPYLHGFPDSDPAPHNNFNTYAYFTSYVDCFPYADTCYAKLHLDSLTDAHTTSDTHSYSDPDAHCDVNPLRSVCYSRML